MAQCLGDSVWPRVCTLLLSSSRLVLCEGESGQRCRLEGDVCSVWQQVVLKQLQSSLLSPRHGVRCLCSQDIYLTRIRTSQTLHKSHDQARCQVYSPPVEPVVHFITRDSPTVPVTVTLGVSCDIDYRHTSPCTHMTGTRASQAWSKI